MTTATTADTASTETTTTDTTTTETSSENETGTTTATTTTGESPSTAAESSNRQPWKLFAFGSIAVGVVLAGFMDYRRNAKASARNKRH